MEGGRFFAALCICFSLALFLQTSSAKFLVEKHSLTVTSPASIKGTYESAIANFGIPEYGGSMVGTIVYPSVDSDACFPFTSGDHNFKPSPGALPTVVLVDRGNCYFTLKVYDAQVAGASAVIVGDDKEESLITMDAPEDDPGAAKFVENITIPSALVQKSTSDAIKSALLKKEMVNVNLDWRESLPHPDDRVEYEVWTNSNDECGMKCDSQGEFVRNFRGYAQTLEKGGYTQFTPHYITWYCPQSYIDSAQCRSQCINNGRYCAPDPEQDFNVGYDGKDVVVENLRELCVFKMANESSKPWIWWDYVTDFKLRCKMSEKSYNQECSEKVMTSLGVDIRKVRDCVGDPTRDAENPVLKAEQQAQVGTDTRSDITILPTVVINNRQYRGKLDPKAVLKAICSGFMETSDPPTCLGADIQTNECLDNNGGCWKAYNQTACKDTFRGRVCECPKDPVTGVRFVGDGYTKCEAAGPGRCLVNNGGCWETNHNGVHFTACQDMLSDSGCKCPQGFSGDGRSCIDINECEAKTACNCPDCMCKNKFGSYECKCRGDSVYLSGTDTCISKVGRNSPKFIWWLVTGVVLLCLSIVGVIGYVIYKYRLRSYMDSEIRAIMAQYMPLDSQNEPIINRNHDEGE
eukprot:TRINITY_DN8230_c0_g1_i1.p1 TRINITY_DN8230_c0_g1~~TRINITY_DN8230_c0_g1_i1.p1  ORF type:complete len:646 (+),score=135.92 TRINITY_DN8230_c0_g1_i1:41-1939(+)